MTDLHDLEVLIGSRTPIVVVETHEEGRVVDLFKGLAIRMAMPLFKWTVTEGLRRLDLDYEPQGQTREPDQLLSHIKASSTPGLYLLSDFHPFLDEAVNVRFLKDIALAYQGTPHTVVLLSHEITIPPELERFCARFELSVPSREKVKSVVLEEAKVWSRGNSGRNVTTSQRMLDALIENLVGLPERDVQRLARSAIEDDGAITETDLPEIAKAKFELLGQDGVLSFEYDTARFADVGGLSKLKAWLEMREPVFSGQLRRPGLDVPKGILLLGVQGCGKSLAAKAVAGAWGIPLLRLDFGSLYNKFYGESERNLRQSLKQAEVMAPCALWVDEIEKGVAADGNDSGTSRRILGTLLTWMAENEARVFIVATANDIESLPPELLRKGRLDEIFFVDLPDAGTRQRILAIHLHKRDIDPKGIDVDAVAKASDGFSGAEVEQAVVSAIYAAYAREAPVDTRHLLEEIRRTRPLSVVMAERVAGLRSWAAQRTVPAN